MVFEEAGASSVLASRIYTRFTGACVCVMCAEMEYEMGVDVGW